METVHKFIVLKHLAQTQYSNVYLCCRPENTAERFVLKRIVKNHSSALHEAMLHYEISQLCSKYFVKFYDLIITEEEVYILLEYLEKGSLLDEIGRQEKQGCKYSPTELNDRVNDLLQAVAFLHEKHIVHRDIKPNNVLVRKNGSLVLTDFGLARKIPTEGTITTILNATPHYATQIPGTPQKNDASLLGKTILELVGGSKLDLPHGSDEESLQKFKDLVRKTVDKRNCNPAYYKLIRNLTKHDPEVRWTINEAINYFEEEIRTRSNVTDDMFTSKFD